MKSRILLPKLLVLALFAGLFLVSCGKEESQNGTEDQQQEQASKISSEADAEAEVVFNTFFDDAMGVNTDVALGSTGIFGRTLACPEITITHAGVSGGTIVFPARVVIDFGPVGCEKRGHWRKGKIIIEYTNRLTIPNAMAVMTFDHYFIDTVKVEGIYKVKNTSPGLNTQPLTKQFSIDVIDAKLSKPNGDYTIWNSHHDKVQVEGLTTNAGLDDVFKITGAANGRVRRGNLISLWESTIIEPLYKKMICPWVGKGKVRTIRTGTAANGPWVAILDFGNGDCDRFATITINGRIHQITLP